MVELLGISSYLISILILMGIYAIFSLGLNLEWGFTGLINFGHVAFFGLGAYITILLNLNGILLTLSVIAGVIVAGFFGFLMGIPTLRLREDYLAIVTVGFSEIVRYFLLNEKWLTGGPFGLYGYTRPLAGIIPTKYYNYFLLVLIIVILVFSYLFLEKIINSPWGRILKSIRDDEKVSSALGKNVFKYKLQVITIGSALAGLAGCLLAFYLQYINPSNFQPIQTFYAWVIVVLGGSANNKGTILGAFLFYLFMSGTRFAQDYIPIASAKFGSIRMIIIGLLLVLLMLYKPEGLLGKREELKLEA